MKNKFDKLSNAKNFTRDSSCHLHSRDAMKIARNILMRTHSITLHMRGFINDVETDAKNVDASSRLGGRKTRRRIWALGVKKEKETDPLMEHLGTMTSPTF